MLEADSTARCREPGCMPAQWSWSCPLALLLYAFLSTASALADSDTQSNPPSLDILKLSLYDLGKVKVMSNSFYDQSLLNTPGNVTVIERQDLSYSPTQNLVELLEFHVPGIHVGASEQYGPLLGIRGVQKTTNSDSMVLFNGRPLNQKLFFGYTAGYSVPLLGDLAQLEVIKGPGSLVHGSGAVAGFFNLVPKNGTDNAGFFAGAEYGTVDNLRKVEFGYGKQFSKHHDWFIYGGAFHADGYRFDDDYGASESPDFRQIAADLSGKKVGGYPRPGIKISTNYRFHDFSFSGLFQKVDIHPDTFIPRYDEDASWQQTILVINPKYQLKLTDHERLEVNAGFELIDFGIENRKTIPFRGFAPGTDAGGAEYHHELKGVFSSSRFNRHRLALGLSYAKRRLIDDDQFFAEAPAEPHFSTVKTDWQEYAMFFEDIFDIRKDLVFSLGLRYDYVEYSPIQSIFFSAAGQGDSFTIPNRNNLSYRAALAHKLSAFTNLKLSVQSGFHYPDAADYVENATFSTELLKRGQPALSSLRPEKLTSIELSLSRLFPQQSLNTEISLYHNHHSDPLLFFNLRNATNRFSQTAIDGIINGDSFGNAYGFFGAFENSVQSFDAIGLEAKLNWKASPALTVDLGYSYSIPVNVDTLPQGFTQISFISSNGDEWLAFPEHQLKASVDYRRSKWRFNLSSILESKVSIEAPQAVSNQGIEREYFRLNGRLEYTLSSHSSVYLLAKNIFANSTPPASFINYRPFNGNLGVDERLVYLGYRYRY